MNVDWFSLMVSGLGCLVFGYVLGWKDCIRDMKKAEEKRAEEEEPTLRPYGHVLFYTNGGLEFYLRNYGVHDGRNYVDKQGFKELREEVLAKVAEPIESRPFWLNQVRINRDIVSDGILIASFEPLSPEELDALRQVRAPKFVAEEPVEGPWGVGE